jgi:hypothetical protein
VREPPTGEEFRATSRPREREAFPDASPARAREIAAAGGLFAQ